MYKTPVCHFMRHLAIWLMVVMAAPASAGTMCEAPAKAMMKASQQPRLAWYTVKDTQARPVGQPFIYRVGKVSCTMGICVNDPDDGNFLLAARAAFLLESEQKGSTRCEALGAATYHDTAVTKYRFEDISDYHWILWIAKDSGLPVYHEMVPNKKELNEKIVEAIIGEHLAWVYGAAVPDPERVLP